MIKFLKNVNFYSCLMCKVKKVRDGRRQTPPPAAGAAAPKRPSNSRTKSEGLVGDGGGEG